MLSLNKVKPYITICWLIKLYNNISGSVNYALSFQNLNKGLKTKGENCTQHQGGGRKT